MRLDDGRLLNNFTPVPKTLAKKIRDTKFSEKERHLIDVIIEQTFGYEAFKIGGESFKRTTKPMSSRYLALLIGYSRSAINRYVDNLADRSILTVDYEWFNGQRTKTMGMNLDLWQWDAGNRVSKREYQELHKQAKQIVKKTVEAINPSYKLVEGKRRDKTDFRFMVNGVYESNLNVIVKVSWGEEIVIDNLKVPSIPNTKFCFVNKPMTRMAVIEPNAIKDLMPRKNLPPPVKEKEYIEVPNTRTPSGRRRISSINLLLPIPCPNDCSDDATPNTNN